MRSVICTLLTLMVGTASALAVAGTVSVTAVNADRFTDAGQGRHEIDATVRQLSAILAKLGERYLPPQQTLRVDLLDVQLAGRERLPAGLAGNVRIVNGKADWPRIRLRYSLEQNGQVLQHGEESIADLSYTQHPGVYHSTSALPYEQQMLSDWFHARFVQHRLAPSAR